MPEMDGDQAIKKLLNKFIEIKYLIKFKNCQNCIIVGHSSDEDIKNINNFYYCGADYFEKKPPLSKNIKRIVDS
jgi:hypothetical protein